MHPEAGRQRARRLYPNLESCDLCSRDAIERHHKDGNVFNNERHNIMFACRRDHMKVDGRLDALKVNSYRAPRIYKQCTVCGLMMFPLRKHRCHACNEYFRRHGYERPVGQFKGELYQKCVTCGEIFPYRRACKRCPTCSRENTLTRGRAYAKARREKIKTRKGG
mgnify:FL=1